MGTCVLGLSAKYLLCFCYEFSKLLGKALVSAGSEMNLDTVRDAEARPRIRALRRIGFCRHEVGLRFVDTGIETTTRLSRLATRNRLRRVMEAA